MFGITHLKFSCEDATADGHGSAIRATIMQLSPMTLEMNITYARVYNVLGSPKFG